MARIDYVRRNGLDESDKDVKAFLANEIGASELTDRLQEKACNGQPDNYEIA
jgi:hypothetical protein